MRILYLINYAGKGGTETYVRALAEAYHKQRAECFFAYNEYGPLAAQMEDMGIECFKLTMHSAYDIAAAKKLADICRINRIDIIHTQFPRENYIAVLSKLFYNKVKLFNTSHLIIHTGAVWRVTNKIFTRQDEKIFSVCNAGKQALEENGVCSDKIEVIFNGIKLDNSVCVSEIRKELGIDESTFVISALTRYSSEKGLDFLVQTVDALRKITERKFAVLIAGDGDMYDEIANKIDSAGLRKYIFQLGFRKDTGNILCGSDLFVNLSSTEALSFAILEALGYGLPVVATDVGGTGDIINSDTNCGILVKYNDANEASKAIEKLMSDIDFYDLCSQNAYKTVKEKFNINKMLDMVFKRYEEALR